MNWLLWVGIGLAYLFLLLLTWSLLVVSGRADDQAERMRDEELRG